MSKFNRIRLEVQNYKTILGEELYVKFEKNEEKMQYTAAGWFYEFDVSTADAVPITYQYRSTFRLDVRKRVLPTTSCSMTIIDDWTAPKSTPWQSDAFNVLLAYKRPIEQAAIPPAYYTVFKCIVPFIQPDDDVYVCGQTADLGSWDPEKALKMEHVGAREFCSPPVMLSQTAVQFKYVVKHHNSLTWEEGANRQVAQITQIVNGFFAYPYVPQPRFAGVNVPVFSLNTVNSFGCGEFADLKVLADFCQRSGLKIIQILPIFDTISTGTWVDSYPYGAITVFALHPMFASIGAIKGVSESILKEMEAKKGEMFKDIIEIQYEKVTQMKINWMQKIYKKQLALDHSALVGEILTWVNSQPDIKYWMPGYCVFKYLAEQFETVDFNKWTIKSFYNNTTFEQLSNEDKQKVIVDLFDNKSNSFTVDEYESMLFYAWMQMQLDTQLLEAANYCRLRGIILKGDVPIGVNRVSIDTWERTKLFNMDTSTGAPPDAFSATGQNWGFPTYNWEYMRFDDFNWWQMRFRNMGRYFDAFRIDHVLGWYRIWEIPADCIKGNGRLGRFYPAQPMNFNKISQDSGMWDRKRLCEPWNPEDIADKVCPRADINELICLGIIKQENGFYKLSMTEVNAELRLKELVKTSQLTDMRLKELINSVVLMNANRCLSYDRQFPDDCHPIFCNMKPETETYSFSRLPEHNKQYLRFMADQYFYKWHQDIWGITASERLPIVGKASNMLIIGEDLGLVAPIVPKKMSEFGLLGLRVQRMPADPKQDFWKTEEYEWMTVCTPGTHDSPGLRSWWLKKEVAEKYWQQQFGRRDNGYLNDISDADCRNIMRKHLFSNSMIAVFLFQDLLSINKKFWYCGDVTREDINHPDVAEWNWKYHIHMTLEELMVEGLCEDIKKEVEKSGRVVE